MKYIWFYNEAELRGIKPKEIKPKKQQINKLIFHLLFIGYYKIATVICICIPLSNYLIIKLSNLLPVSLSNK